MLQDLPNDILLKILTFVNSFDYYAIKMSNKIFYNVLNIKTFSNANRSMFSEEYYIWCKNENAPVNDEHKHFYAAYCGNICYLKKLHQLETNLYKYSILNDQLNVFQFLRENNCVWTSQMCPIAKQNKKFLKYLFDHRVFCSDYARELCSHYQLTSHLFGS